MIRTPEGDLEQELRDPEYVKLYGASDAKAEIAITLANVRRAARKTQKELADAMGLRQPYVARLEGGDANPTIGTIGSILAMLGCRLVARTALLLPEPVSPTIEPMLTAGTDANMVDVTTGQVGREQHALPFSADEYSSLVAVGTASGWHPVRAGEYSSKAVVGGSV